MLGIGCPDRHALPRITLSKMRRPRRVLPSRASGFVLRREGVIRHSGGRAARSPPVARFASRCCPAAASMIRISNSSRITPAGRSATILAIATRSWRSCSSSSRRWPIGRNAGGCLGDRQEAAGGRGAAAHLPLTLGDLRAAASQGADRHGQQSYNGWRMEDVWLDR